MKRYIKSAVRDLSKESRTTKRDIARYSGTSPRDLRRIAEECSDNTTRMNLASNPNTPADILEALAKEKTEDWEVNEYALANPSISPEVLKQMSTDKRHWIRRGIAANPNTPVDILKRYAKSTAADIRLQIADNPSTPIEILEQMLGDTAPIVRDHACVYLYRRGARSGDWCTREMMKNMVAGN